MSGELARAVRRSNEYDLALASSLGGAVGEFWGGDAFPYRVGQRHYEFVALSDERVPIPQRGKE